MSSITIDFITLLWGFIILIPLTSVAHKRKSYVGLLMVVSVGLYLMAQSGWTTSYLSGYEWGRDLSNYVWFIFNSSVLTVYTIWICQNDRKEIPTKDPEA